MDSFIAWMSFSESERRRVMEAIDTLRQKDARDELSLDAIRDGFADLLFPGTGTVRTRHAIRFPVGSRSRPAARARGEGDLEGSPSQRGGPMPGRRSCSRRCGATPRTRRPRRPPAPG